jgi:hypothetical protein
MPRRETISYEVENDGGLLFDVEKASNGILTALVRVYGYVIVNGKRYSYDRNFRVRLSRKERATATAG